MTTKICSKCGIEKDVSEFYKAKNSKRGDCKECRRLYCKEYYQKNKAQLSVKNKVYQENHVDEIREWRKNYHQDNKPEIAKKKKILYDKNKVAIAVQKKIYQQDHKDEIRQYCKDNKERRARNWSIYSKTEAGIAANLKHRHKRRALKKGAKTQDFSPIEILKRDGYRCQICHKKTRPDYKNPNHPLYPNLDHIIPLSKGGEHSRLNTQCLCHQCNTEKRNKEDFGDQQRLFG